MSYVEKCEKLYLEHKQLETLINDIETELKNKITQLEIFLDSSFNVDKKAIQHQKVAYKHIVEIIQEKKKFIVD